MHLICHISVQVLSYFRSFLKIQILLATASSSPDVDVEKPNEPERDDADYDGGGDAGNVHGV